MSDKETLSFIPHDDTTKELDELRIIYESNLRIFILKTVREALID